MKSLCVDFLFIDEKCAYTWNKSDNVSFNTPNELTSNIVFGLENQSAYSTQATHACHGNLNHIKTHPVLKRAYNFQNW